MFHLCVKYLSELIWMSLMYIIYVYIIIYYIRYVTHVFHMCLISIRKLHTCDIIYYGTNIVTNTNPYGIDTPKVYFMRYISL